jgi:hypothetical protein
MMLVDHAVEDLSSPYRRVDGDDRGWVVGGWATRTAVTARITAHVKRGWPRLRTPLVRFRGQFCYVDAVLPAHRQPTPILRLRYQGTADR